MKTTEAGSERGAETTWPRIVKSGTGWRGKKSLKDLGGLCPAVGQ